MTRGRRRHRDRDRAEFPPGVPGWSGLPPVEHGDASTSLHEERLGAVVSRLVASGARTVLDLGCGSGSLLGRLLAESQFDRIVGIDTSAESLLEAERRLATHEEVVRRRLTLRNDSFMELGARDTGFDAAVMVETVEHIAPEQLSRLEHSVFATARPRLVLMTTPNREYNVLYGLGETDLRHPDHRFEWTRARLRAWAGGVGGRNGYRAELADVGRSDPLLGAPTQMAIFSIG